MLVYSAKCTAYTLLFVAKCKAACMSGTADVLYILLLLDKPAIRNTEEKSYIFFLFSQRKSSSSSPSFHVASGLVVAPLDVFY